jgi:hypothetical protein
LARYLENLERAVRVEKIEDRTRAQTWMMALVLVPMLLGVRMRKWHWRLMAHATELRVDLVLVRMQARAQVPPLLQASTT